MVSRRAFLGLGAGVAALAASGGIAAALVSGSSGPSGVDLVLVPDDWDFISGRPYRLAFLLANNRAGGAPLPIDAPVTVEVAPPGRPFGAPMPAVIHANGEQPAYALTTYTFAQTGSYQLRAHFKGMTATTPVDVIDAKDSATPVIGQKMISVPTPTVANHRGVNPYCTQVPPCPFHAVSLDDALAAHRPVALQFATPALCTSHFCGPVLQNLVATSGPWRDKVTFIHSEIYTALDTSAPTTPAVQAWGLQHEPMLYLGNADGVIVDRIDNLFDQDEARAALARAFS